MWELIINNVWYLRQHFSNWWEFNPQAYKEKGLVKHILAWYFKIQSVPTQRSLKKIEVIYDHPFLHFGSEYFNSMATAWINKYKKKSQKFNYFIYIEWMAPTSIILISITPSSPTSLMSRISIINFVTHVHNKKKRFPENHCC